MVFALLLLADYHPLDGLDTCDSGLCYFSPYSFQLENGIALSLWKHMELPIYYFYSLDRCSWEILEDSFDLNHIELVLVLLKRCLAERDHQMTTGESIHLFYRLQHLLKN